MNDQRQADPRSPREYVFGDCRLDLDRGELSVGGNVARLRPKSLQVFTLLLANAGTLVSKQQLLDTVWPDVAVSDDTLTQSIADIRRALGAGKHGLIKTLPRRGYLLDATVHAGSENGGVPAADGGRRRVSRSPAARGNRFAVPAAILIVAACMVAIGAGTSPPSELPADVVRQARGEWRPIVLVTVRSGDSAEPQMEYLANGIGREVQLELARMAGVRTIAYSSALDATQDRPWREAATTLGAAFALVGHVEDRADAVVIEFSLNAVEAGTPLWSDTIRQSDVDVLALRRTVGESVRAALGRAGEPVRPEPRDTNREAYAAYVRAKAMFDSLGSGTASEARELLQHALALEPDFAPAIRELYVVNWFELNEDPGNISAADVRRLRALLERAQKLAPDDAATLAYLAWHEMDFNGDFTAGARLAARALEMNPFDEDVLRVSQFIVFANGDFDGAVALGRFATRYNPRCLVCRWSLIQSLTELGDYEAAMQAVGVFQDMYAGGWTSKAVLHLALGDPQEALAAVSGEALEAYRRYVRILAFHALDRPADVAAERQLFEQLPPADAALEAALAVQLDDADAAFLALHRYIDAQQVIRDGRVVNYRGMLVGAQLHRRVFADLRKDPRWKQLAERIYSTPPPRDSIVSELPVW